MTEPKRPYPNGVPIAPDTVMPPRRSVRWGATADSPPTEIHDDPGLTRAYLAGLAAGRTEAAADFDRLRDERDRLDSRITELQQNEAHAHRLAFEARTARAEAERVAGVLADALDAKLRDGRDDHGESGECPCEQCEQAYLALAVFDTARAIAEEATRFECGDTLTEEKTDE